MFSKIRRDLGLQQKKLIKIQQLRKQIRPFNNETKSQAHKNQIYQEANTSKNFET